MKVFEVIGNPAAAQPIAPQPTALKQQTRVGQVVKQMTASDAKQQKPNAIDFHLAAGIHRQQQRQANQVYAKRLRQQLASAQSQVK